jgi:hypothetical protein
VFLKLNGDENGERENIIAEWSGDTKDFLEDTLVGDTLHFLRGTADVAL